MVSLIGWLIPASTALHPAVRPPDRDDLKVDVPGLGRLSDDQAMALAVLVLVVHLVLGSVW